MNMDKPVCQKPWAWDRAAVSLVVPGTILLGLMLLAPNVPLVIFAGILLAVLISASGGWIANRLHCARRIGIALFLLMFNLALAGLFITFVPAIVEQVNAFVEQVPAAIEALRKAVEDIPWLDRLLTGATPSTLFSGESREMTTGAVASTFSAFGNIVIVLFVGLFGALDPNLYRRGVLHLLAASLRPRAHTVLDIAGDTMRRWLVAQLIAMTLVGVLTGIGMWMIGVPLPLLLGLIAGMLAFIPNLGPVIAAIPAMLLAVPLGGQAVLFVVLVFVLVQALESYAVTPLLQLRTVSLPPALVIGVQLLMGTLFGLMGLLLATPLAAVAMTLINATYVEHYLDHD